MEILTPANWPRGVHKPAAAPKNKQNGNKKTRDRTLYPSPIKSSLFDLADPRSPQKFHTALVHFSSNLSHMTRAASETKSLTAAQWIVSHVNPGRNYRPHRGKGDKRKQLGRARKSVAGRYYQLISGQAATAHT